MPTTRSGRRSGPSRKSERFREDGHDQRYDEVDDNAAGVDDEDDEFDDDEVDEDDVEHAPDEDDEEDDEVDEEDEEDEDDERPEPAGDMSAHEAARAGLRYIADLTGKPPTGVASLERGDDGWLVGVEVVEDQRVPSSADILATYQTRIGMDGELLGYERTRRYPRGRGDSDSGGR